VAADGARGRRERGLGTSAALAVAAAVVIAHPARGAPAGLTPPRDAPPARSEGWAVERGTAGSLAAVRAPLEMRLNRASRLPVIALLARGDAWVDARDLTRAGLIRFGGARREVGGVEYVSLASLAPELTFTLDERALLLDLEAGPELLPRERVDLAPVRPAGMIEGGDASAFANYSLQYGTAEVLTAAGEAGLSAGGGLLWSSFSGRSGGGVVRGLSSASLDDLGRLRRWTLGDAVASAGGNLGSSLVLGGLSLARDFSLDPYFVQGPRIGTTAFAGSPSVLEVWVNNSLVRRQEIAPGTIDLANVPVVAGSNSVRTVLRDAYGREQAFDLRTTFAAGLLAPGLSDYGYHFGFVRQAYGDRSFEYGDAVLLLRHRIGFTDGLTGGVRVEATGGRAMAGPTLAVGTPLGEVDLEAAGSTSEAGPGAAGAGSWSWIGRRVSGGLRLRGASPRFASASLAPEADRALVEASAFASFPVVTRVGLGLEATGARLRDGGASRSLTVRSDLSIGRGIALLCSATLTSRGGSTTIGGLALFSFALGARDTVQTSVQASGGAVTGSAGAARSLPVGPGYGYRAEASAGAGEPRGAGAVQLQTGFGRYEATFERSGPAQRAAVSAAGGVVLIGGRVFLSRPVDDAFALLRVPGVAGVRGYLENHEVGRTDARGDLFVPALLPRYGNRLSIRASDVSMDYDLGKLERLVAPPRKGGLVARFAAERIRAVTGRLAVENGGSDEVPSFGEVVATGRGGAFRSPTTSDGRFFLERLAPGAYAAEVVWSGGRCRFALDVPEASAGVRDLGRVACLPEPPAVSAAGQGSGAG
jgi:outer membrane usher protein